MLVRIMEGWMDCRRGEEVVMQCSRFLSGILAGTWIAFSSACAAETVNLVVDIGAVSKEAPYPVRSGVPFAKGKIRSPDQIRALVAGKEIDLQARPLATWPDGSVKWLLLDFMGKNGEAVTVEYGADVKRQAPAKAIKVAKD